MQIGNRIIYNKLTGMILNHNLEQREDSGLTQELIDDMRPMEIDFIDLQFGEINGKRVISVNVETKRLITEDIVKPQTEAERIAELENIILESEGLV